MVFISRSFKNVGKERKEPTEPIMERVTKPKRIGSVWMFMELSADAQYHRGTSERNLTCRISLESTEMEEMDFEGVSTFLDDYSAFQYTSLSRAEHPQPHKWVIKVPSIGIDPVSKSAYGRALREEGSRLSSSDFRTKYSYSSNWQDHHLTLTLTLDS